MLHYATTTNKKKNIDKAVNLHDHLLLMYYESIFT